MKLKDKFKNLSAFTFQTDAGELMVCFNGFEDMEDMIEFKSYIFAKLNVDYYDMDKQNPSIH